MEAAPQGKVVYKSKDALQNLRIKVSLTRVSAPRADRAAELDARIAEQQRGPSAGGLGGVFGNSSLGDQVTQAAAGLGQAAAGFGQAAAEIGQAAAGRAPADPAPTPPAAPGFEAADAGDDVSASAAANAAMPSYAPPAPGGRRARSSLQTAHGAPMTMPGQGAGDGPYGGGGSAGAVTESDAAALDASNPAALHSQHFPAHASDASGATAYHFERVVAWQEKIFSPVDFARRRSQSAAPETELDRKYKAMVHEPGARGEVIYTYVSADRFADERDAERFVTTSPSEPYNGLFKAVFGTPGDRVLARNASGPEATRLRTALARGRKMRAGPAPATFAICADCGPLQLPPDHAIFKSSPDGRDAEREEVLMFVEAYPDGTIVLTPDFTEESAGELRRVERRDGSVWEYSVSNASAREETPIEKRAADIAPVAALRRLQLARANRSGQRVFHANLPEGPDPVRLVFLGEIVSGRGFERDNLYCEWTLEYDPALWSVEATDHLDPDDPNKASSIGRSSPEALAGVTQISRTATYPATGDGEGDGAFSGDRRVAHWGLPLELALVAGRKPEANEYPCVLFQVSSYDRWDRYRCEGYGRLALGGLEVGASETAVKTWRAGGTITDRLRAHYVGGSPEIGDLAYVGVPRDAKGQKVHSRLGFVADASGEIKIRAHVATQRRRGRSKAAASGVGKLKAGLFGKKGFDPNDSNRASRPGATGESTEGSPLDDLDDKPRTEREVEDVVARARARVAEARSRGRDFGRAAAAADFARPARGQGQVPPAAASEPEDVLARARQRHARAQPPDQENERPIDHNPAATGFTGAGAGGWGLGADAYAAEGGAATKAQEPAPGGWGLGAESLS